jgi:hypothetical protein
MAKKRLKKKTKIEVALDVPKKMNIWQTCRKNAVAPLSQPHLIDNKSRNGLRRKLK